MSFCDRLIRQPIHYVHVLICFVTSNMFLSFFLLRYDTQSELENIGQRRGTTRRRAFVSVKTNTKIIRKFRPRKKSFERKKIRERASIYNFKE